MNIADFIAILSLVCAVFSIGYQIGYHHGKQDDSKKKTKK
jgi:hypothetical protein